MRTSPLFLGIVYIALGLLFTFWAINIVNRDGMGILSTILLLVATFDIGGGIRLISIHFRSKK